MRYIVKCICSLRKHAYLPNEESAAHLRPRKVTFLLTRLIEVFQVFAKRSVWTCSSTAKSEKVVFRLNKF